VLDMLPELGADAVIQLGQPTDAVTAAFNAEGLGNLNARFGA